MQTARPPPAICLQVPFPAIRPAYLKLKTELRKDVKSHSPAIKALLQLLRYPHFSLGRGSADRPWLDPSACRRSLQLAWSSWISWTRRASYPMSHRTVDPKSHRALLLPRLGLGLHQETKPLPLQRQRQRQRIGMAEAVARHPIRGAPWLAFIQSFIRPAHAVLTSFLHALSARSREVSPNRREAYGRERGGRRERDRDHSPQGVRPTPPPKPSTPVRETQDLVPPRVRDLDDSSPSRARRPSPIHPSAGSPAQGVPRESQQHRQSALRPDAEPFVPSCAEPPSKRHRDPEPPETAKRAKKVVEAIPVGDVEETEEGAKSTISIATKGIKRKDRMKDKEREKWRDGRSKDKGREVHAQLCLVRP